MKTMTRGLTLLGALACVATLAIGQADNAKADGPKTETVWVMKYSGGGG